jgi:hypothetical protein
VIRVFGFRLRDPQPVAALAGLASWDPRMAQDTTFPLSGETNLDDLPRTLRREHEARAREARERDGPSFVAMKPSIATEAPSGPSSAAASAPSAPDMTYLSAGSFAATPAVSAPVPAVVKAVDVPFGDLVAFFLKAVLAAVPALILLMAILWGVGQIIEIVAPSLLKMKILISFPNS